ncbi:MAG: hypothetical protein U5K72_13060 [Balneolaceae bacterium]|nr:hypothetical protein [Balneolaceae bacterium]
MLAPINIFFSLIERIDYCSLIFSVLFCTAISCSTKSTPSYQLTTSSIPAEGGSVSPASGEFDEGDDVQLQATANENWVFDGWEGDQTGTQNPLTVTMDSDKSINARFVKRQYPLTINVQGEGSVSESIVQTKMTDYEHGTVVELQANSDMGYNFARWEGAIESTDNPVQITVDGPKEVTVVFEPSEFNVQVRSEGPGTVSVEPEKEIYTYNETVQFTAMPNSNNEFLGWFNESGSFEMLEAEFEYQITEDLDIAAYFSSVEDAFVFETVEIVVEDGLVVQVGMNITNFLLGKITLIETTVLDENDSEYGVFDFEGFDPLEARTRYPFQGSFQGETTDEETFKEWSLVWEFEYEGSTYTKTHVIGEPSGSAKDRTFPIEHVGTATSIQLNIK